MDIRFTCIYARFDLKTGYGLINLNRFVSVGMR